LKEILVKNKALPRLRSRKEIYEREIESGLKSCQPGEWVKVSIVGVKGLSFLGIANPTAQNSAPLKLLKSLGIKEEVSEEGYLESALTEAVQKREVLLVKDENRRLVFGDADGLPGLIVDEYENVILVQINSAGIDRHREFVKNVLTGLREKEVLFFDNNEYRQMEGLPLYEKNSIPDIEARENGLTFLVNKEVMQKIGYYFDHRINRKKLINWIEQVLPNLSKKKNGVDLFSYSGSWGVHGLKAGLEHVTFIDQGNFGEVIDKNLELNDFKGKGEFHRGDVFSWLKDCKETYDVVISDPPAFSKSLKNKSKALGGYQKLHRSLSQIVHSGSLLAIGSCTHGISIEELDQSVSLGFKDSPFQLQLLELGMQGPDHPISHLSDSMNYIKFLLYRVTHD